MKVRPRIPPEKDRRDRGPPTNNNKSKTISIFSTVVQSIEKHTHNTHTYTGARVYNVHARFLKPAVRTTAPSVYLGLD